MSGHRPFTELAAPIMADPERRARVESIEREMEMVINLGQLREQMQRTQQGSSSPTRIGTGWSGPRCARTERWRC